MFESMHGPGLSKKHVLWSERTEKENKSVSMHRVYVSTLFVVTLLAHFSRKPGKSTAVAGDEAKAGLQEFIAWLAPSLQCAINFDLGEHHPTYQLEVDDGQASLADLCKSNGYKAKMPGQICFKNCGAMFLNFWGSSFFFTEPACFSLDHAGGSSTIPMKARGWLPLSAVLAFLTQRPQLKWLAAQLLDGVARKADTSIPFLKLPQECLEVSFESRRLRDPMLRARALQLCRARFGKGKTGAKNRVDKGASAATKARRRADAAAAKAIVTCRDKAQERSQYLVAARQAFAGSNRVCVAFDASRGGGRKRTNFACLDLCSGWSCWAPPQARIAPKFYSA